MPTRQNEEAICLSEITLPLQGLYDACSHAPVVRTHAQTKGRHPANSSIAPLETLPAKRTKTKGVNARVPRRPESNSVPRATLRCFPEVRLCEPVGSASLPCVAF